MADTIYRKVYIGTQGPYLVPVDRLINDADGDFVGMDYGAIVTDGEIIINSTPTTNNSATTVKDVNARILLATEVSDITNPVELGNKDALKDASMLVYERRAGAANYWTLYAGDEDCPADSPYVVPGKTNYWVAVSGHYTARTTGTIDPLVAPVTLDDITNKVNELIQSLTTYGLTR